VTTRARHYVCDDYKDQPPSSSSSSSSSSAAAAGTAKRNCEMETGYYLNPRDSCQTYSVFGRLPPLDAFQRSIVCVRPGRLTNMFDVSHQLADTATIFVDKTIKYVVVIASKWIFPFTKLLQVALLSVCIKAVIKVSFLFLSTIHVKIFTLSTHGKVPFALKLKQKKNCATVSFISCV